jgi:hypothetical protein
MALSITGAYRLVQTWKIKEDERHHLQPAVIVPVQYVRTPGELTTNQLPWLLYLGTLCASSPRPGTDTTLDASAQWRTQWVVQQARATRTERFDVSMTSGSSRSSSVSLPSTTTLFTTKSILQCIPSIFYVKIEGCPHMVCFRVVDLLPGNAERNIAVTDKLCQACYQKIERRPKVDLAEKRILWVTRKNPKTGDEIVMWEMRHHCVLCWRCVKSDGSSNVTCMSPIRRGKVESEPEAHQD